MRLFAKKFCLFSELLVCSSLSRRLSFLGPYDYALVCITRVQPLPIWYPSILRFGSCIIIHSNTTLSTPLPVGCEKNCNITRMSVLLPWLSMYTSNSSAQVPNSPKANGVLPPFPSLMNHITPAYLNTVYI